LLTIAQKNNSGKFNMPKLYDYFNKKQNNSTNLLEQPESKPSEVLGTVIILPIDNMRCYEPNMQLVEKFREAKQKLDYTFIPNISK
jgi:hypothetical protein